MHMTYLKKLKTIILITFCTAALSSVPVFAGDAGGETDRRDNKTREAESGQQRWAAFPIIASSPETGFMYGGMLFHFFPVSSPEQQASTIDLMAFGTTEEQYGLIFSPNILIDKGRYRLNTSLFYKSWTANYYGIGNDSSDDSEEYDSKTYGAALTVEIKIYDSFVIGLLGSYVQDDISTESGGVLNSEPIIGSRDYESAGLGFRAGYDSRDNTNAPYTGTLAVYEHIWYGRDLGGDNDFDIQSLDLRHYIPVFDNKVLALSAQLEDSHGDVPFRLLPSPDGTMILRGIENGRFRDKMLLGFQSEYRFPMRKKLSGAFFAEAAQVGDDYSDIEVSAFKTSVGGGIRYALNHDQRFNLRADIAWVDNGIGVIINVREAF